MLSSILAIVSRDSNWYFDNKAESLIYAIIGFLVVFAGIVILIAILYFVGFIFKKVSGKKLSLKEKVATIQRDEKTEENITEQEKAAIIAAIMAYYVEEKPECDFVVKRIKRI